VPPDALKIDKSGLLLVAITSRLGLFVSFGAVSDSPDDVLETNITIKKDKRAMKKVFTVASCQALTI
jgi:hypothetical protein